MPKYFNSQRRSLWAGPILKTGFPLHFGSEIQGP